ncbi:MAG: hypothetical protein ACRD2K_06210 [Terriglobales bacterium]
MIFAASAFLATALLYYVFFMGGPVEHATGKTRLAYLRERKEVVYENLRDLNFEYKAGKFPESDYLQMRSALEDEAAIVLAEIGQLEASEAEASYK